MKNGLPCQSQHSSRKQESTHAPGLKRGFSETKLLDLDRFIDERCKSSSATVFHGRQLAVISAASLDVIPICLCQFEAFRLCEEGKLCSNVMPVRLVRESKLHVPRLEVFRCVIVNGVTYSSHGVDVNLQPT